MQIEEILQGVACLRRSGPSAEVSGVEYDSRRIAPGSLFVAIRGETTDGNRYVKKAIDQGAVAVVTDSSIAFDDLVLNYPQIAVAEAAHGRNALALIAENFFSHPEKQLSLCGVTGTNGKTTTAYLLDAMLNYADRKTVLIGTIEYHVAGAVRPSPHTTPESRDLLELLRDGADAGATEAVMEVSSHALAQGRVYGLPFDVAIFTNLTRDHLDFHGTMENYFAAKRSLFDGRNGSPPRVAVINLDDQRGLETAGAARFAGAEVVTYSWGYDLGLGDFRADDVEMLA